MSSKDKTMNVIENSKKEVEIQNNLVKYDNSYCLHIDNYKIE